jgi:hypothetical protein
MKRNLRISIKLSHSSQTPLHIDNTSTITKRLTTMTLKFQEPPATSPTDASKYGYEDADAAQEERDRLGYGDTYSGNDMRIASIRFADAAEEELERLGYEDAGNDVRMTRPSKRKNKGPRRRASMQVAGAAQEERERLGYGDAVTRPSSMKKKGRARRASIQFGAEIEVRLPCQSNPVKRRLSIEFSHPPEEINLEAEKEAEKWMEKGEYEVIKKRNTKIVKAMERGTDKHFHTRGLEGMMSSSTQEDDRKAAAETVMEEQRLQRNGGHFDEDRIMNRYQIASLQNKIEATDRAEQDTADASKYGYEDADASKYGYEDADASKYGYEDADASKYGYEDADAAQKERERLGYGDAVNCVKSSMKKEGRSRRASIQFGAEIEVRLPSQSDPVKRRLSIEFTDRPEEIKPVPEKKWMEKDEYEKIKKRNTKIVKAVERGTDKNFHMRGLEGMMSGSTQGDDRKAAAKTVMEEQKLQRTGGHYDDERMMERYRMASLQNKIEAADRAEQDTAEVEAYLHSTRRMMRRGSM